MEKMQALTGGLSVVLGLYFISSNEETNILGYGMIVWGLIFLYLFAQKANEWLIRASAALGIVVHAPSALFLLFFSSPSSGNTEFHFGNTFAALLSVFVVFLCMWMLGKSRNKKSS